jgi:hypothetical protein
LPVIEDFDVIKQTGADFLSGMEILELNMFGLDRMHEAFGNGVVIAAQAKTLLQAVLLDQRLHLRTGVLTSSIGVQDEPWSDPARFQSPDQGAGEQLGSQSSTKFPTNNTAGMQVENHREIDPPSTRSDVGDVARPDPIGLSGGKLSLQTVNAKISVPIPLCCGLEASNRFGSNMVRVHQSRHALSPTTDPLISKHRMDPGRSIHAAVSPVDGPDPFQQSFVTLCTGTQGMSSPMVIRTGRDAKNTTHPTNASPPLADKLIHLYPRRENTANAFFKMSRSSFRSSTSRRSLRSSSSSGFSLPFPGKA